MFRVIYPLIHCQNVTSQGIRCLQTLHKEFLLNTRTLLLKEPCKLCRCPTWVEKSAAFCTKDTSESSDIPEVKRVFGEDDIKQLFQKNPKLREEIMAKMIEEYKFYDKNTMLEMAEVKEHYLLTDRDLEKIKRFRRKTPYSSRELKGQKFIYLFYKHEVESLALKKYGTMDIVKKMKENRDVEGIFESQWIDTGPLGPLVCYSTKKIYVKGLTLTPDIKESIGLLTFEIMEPKLKANVNETLPESFLDEIHCTNKIQAKHFYRVAKSAVTGKETMSTGGVVLFAFTVNFCIFLFKFVIYMKTGSSVVFAEVVHSFVDMLNQFILLIGQVISKYPPDDKFPYGHRNYLYISSLGSGGFIFAFGFLTTLVFGVLNGFFATPTVITPDTLDLSLKILFGSGVAECMSLVSALYKYYNDAKASNMPLMKCIREGDDPLAKVVIMEDSASVLGTIVCAVAMTGQYYFKNIYGFPICDMAGNLIITGMLGYVSKVLLSANSEKLVGKALWYEDDIKRDIERYRYVNGVFDIKSIDQDEDSRFKAEVELDAKEIARVIFETSADQETLLQLMQGLTETEAAKVLFVNYSQKFYYEIVKFIDDLEEDLKKKYPEVRHIDIEISGGELPEERKTTQTKKANV